MVIWWCVNHVVPPGHFQSIRWIRQRDFSKEDLRLRRENMRLDIVIVPVGNVRVAREVSSTRMSTLDLHRLVDLVAEGGRSGEIVVRDALCSELSSAKAPATGAAIGLPSLLRRRCKKLPPFVSILKRTRAHMHGQLN